MDTAYFVKYPRTVDDLQRPHTIDSERAYLVVGAVTLGAIDYENFVTDMRADRQFIEDGSGSCSEGKPMKCLLVRRRDRRGGVLVVPDSPDSPAYVKWAAYAAEEE